jgi:hypothetical protein
MSDQQYVYTTHETDPQGREVGDFDAVVNEYASEGWRLSETLERDGTTVGLVFERAV